MCFHEAGEYELTTQEFDTPYVLVAVRILVDPADPNDVAAVNALQDGFEFVGWFSGAVRVARIRRGRAWTPRGRRCSSVAARSSGFAHAFGTKDEVDPDDASDCHRRRMGRPTGAGSLLRRTSISGLPVGEYQLTVRDVPVDAFWSISVYNADGYFEPNDRNANTVNSITASPNEDGSVTINFGGCNDDRPNCLPIMEGWNYAVRMYQPRPDILNGSWTFPSPEAA